MQAEILSIGDELTSGQILDTNSQWLSQRLEQLGIRVLYHSTVCDELEADREAFRLALGRADVLVSTGGLGPPADALPRQAIAEATGRRLLMDPAALAQVRAIFARRKRDMPKRNAVQGLMPEGGRIVHNPNGTAPGIFLEVPRPGRAPALLFALPGVPAEMKEMWPAVEESLRKAGAGRRQIVHRVLKCFGAGESQIEAMLPDLIRRGRSPEVGINASGATILLRITVEGDSPAECLKATEPTVATIRDCLGTLVFGEGAEALQDVVVRLLAERGKTLATAEWGTGGMLADWLAAARDGSYRGGIVARDESALRSMLDVSPALLAQLSARISQTAVSMAVGCRKRFQTDFGLAVGPFPLTETPGDPQPVFFGLAAPDGVRVKSMPFAAHPALLKILAAKNALNFLRLALV